MSVDIKGSLLDRMMALGLLPVGTVLTHMNLKEPEKLMADPAEPKAAPHVICINHALDRLVRVTFSLGSLACALGHSATASPTYVPSDNQASPEVPTRTLAECLTAVPGDIESACTELDAQIRQIAGYLRIAPAGPADTERSNNAI